MHLPTWLGALLLGLVPYFLVAVTGDTIAGVIYRQNFLANIDSLVPLTIVIVFIPLLGSIYVSRTIEKVNNYAETLLPVPQNGTHVPTPVNFRSLYSVRICALLAVVFFVLISVTYAGFAPASAQPSYFSISPAFMYAFLVDWTFVWTYIYSMYSIWKIGHFPLAIPPFTEDRTLGLQPFGSASLRLTTIFLVLAISNVLTVHIFATSVPLFVISDLLIIFSVMGLVLFFLPLYGLHKKLVAMKNKEMRWISAEHSAVLKEVRARGSFEDEGLTRRLTNIKLFREDVVKIRGWPLDTEMIARLVTIVIFPLVIALGVPFLLQYL
jgi:uncharacterized membrane protein